jgi:hypothetical protein
VNKNNANTIEIKGKLYDAITGLAVQSTPKAESVVAEEGLSTPPVNQKPLSSDAVRHLPKTSQTLMRAAVKKPGENVARHINITESRDKATAETSSPTLVTPRPDHSQRAALLKQSDQINHFVRPGDTSPVQSEDTVVEAPPPTPEPPKGPADHLLERGLSQATAHEQLPVTPMKFSRRSSSLLAVPAVIVVALLVFGNYAFTNLQLRIASAKAGFSTSLPTYHPAGFTLGQMSYNTGIFASNFYTKNSNQSYTITQKNTSWNTQDVLQDSIRTTTSNYKIIQLGSRTIYLYGNGDAAWISGKIWYQIDSDGSLNESQIIDVANSL